MNPENDATSYLDELHERRRVWREKPHIRLVYERWMKQMRPFLSDKGAILEVGSGSGLTEDLLPGAIRCDLLRAPWLDLAADCARLPFGDESLGAVLAFDTLHHLAAPHAFLREAVRVLRPGGRVLLLEPHITPLSYFGYKILHHEDIYFKAYHRPREGAEKTDPWTGNLALANVVFGREAADWPRLQPSLKIVHKRFLSFFDFQCAAGFKPYAYVPLWAFKVLLAAEDLLSPLMGLIGFRIFVVLEKKRGD